MKIKLSVAGLIIASTMAVAVAPAQATCVKHPAGWHMVSKHCNIKPAENWREYTSGVYTQPMPTQGFLFLGR